MSTNLLLEEATKNVMDFGVWLEAECFTTYDEYSCMSKSERSVLRKQYDEYVKSFNS